MAPNNGIWSRNWYKYEVRPLDHCITIYYLFMQYKPECLTKVLYSCFFYKGLGYVHNLRILCACMRSFPTSVHDFFGQHTVNDEFFKCEFFNKSCVVR